MTLSFAETSEFIRRIHDATGVEPAMIDPERITDLAMMAGISGGVVRELIAHILWQHLNHSLTVELLRNQNADANTEGPVFESDVVSDGSSDDDPQHVRLVRE